MISRCNISFHLKFVFIHMQMQTNIHMSTKTRFEKEAKVNSEMAYRAQLITNDTYTGVSWEVIQISNMLHHCSLSIVVFPPAFANNLGGLNEFAVFSTVITTVQVSLAFVSVKFWHMFAVRTCKIESYFDEKHRPLVAG